MPPGTQAAGQIRTRRMHMTVMMDTKAMHTRAAKPGMNHPSIRVVCARSMQLLARSWAASLVLACPFWPLSRL